MEARAVEGIKAVVKVIKTHIDNASVCYRGCGALWNMVHGNGKGNNKGIENKVKRVDENRAKAGAEKGIEAVVEAINSHIDNVHVCCAGCAVLSTMAINGKNIEKLINNTNKQLRTK